MAVGGAVFTFTLGISLFTLWFYSDRKAWALLWASLWLVGVGLAELVASLINLIFENGGN